MIFSILFLRLTLSECTCTGVTCVSTGGAREAEGGGGREVGARGGGGHPVQQELPSPHQLTLRYFLLLLLLLQRSAQGLSSTAPEIVVQQYIGLRPFLKLDLPLETTS